MACFSESIIYYLKIFGAIVNNFLNEILIKLLKGIIIIKNLF